MTPHKPLTEKELGALIEHERGKPPGYQNENIYRLIADLRAARAALGKVAGDLDRDGSPCDNDGRGCPNEDIAASTLRPPKEPHEDYCRCGYCLVAEKEAP